MTEDKPDVEEHFQKNPDASSPVKTTMFVCACIALVMLAYFGFVVRQ